MPAEILTLQFGNFANYVGAHYWNFQDELLGLQGVQGPAGPARQIDCDVLYRQGETLQGEGTYTPRLVLWDLSGALGSLSSGGSLYRDSNHSAAVVSTWAGRQEVHRAAPIRKSRFAEELEREAEEGAEEEAAAAAAAPNDALTPAGPTPLQAAAQQLDSGGEGGGGVRYFSDYLKAHLHPRSVQQVAGAWHGVTPFGGWGDGEDAWRNEEQREEAMDRIRFFAEECDRLQGFQCMVQDLGGFGGLAARVLQELRDEYGSRQPVMLYALRPEVAAADELATADLRRQRLNEGLSLALLTPLCTTYTVVAPPTLPSALPLLRWQQGNTYHASAVCAAALDTATLPYRLAPGQGPSSSIGRTSMWDLSQMLTAQHSTPLTTLSLSLPCPALPSNLQQQAQAADDRLQHGVSSVSSSGSSGGGGGSGGTATAGAAASSSSPFTSRWLASLTPGMAAAGDADRFAESVVLRGPRSAGAALELGLASEALDGALALERLRCVRQRTLAAQPLAVPLPFPHIFVRGLSQSGDAPAGGKLGGGSQDIASCAVLTRLASTVAFGAAVKGAQRQFRAAAASAQGQATLEAWGRAKEELEDIDEQFSRLAHAYEEEEV